jgi:hypothetical protein
MSNLQTSSFAQRVTAHVDRSDALLSEIRRAAIYLRNRQGYALWKLQLVTGLHKNSLLRLHDPDWLPKPETMVSLAKLVERAQAHRRGETFDFPARRGPGRPPVMHTLALPPVKPTRKPAAKQAAKQRPHGSTRSNSRRAALQ